MKFKASTIVSFVYFTFTLFVFVTPTQAKVDIGQQFGFGDFKSLGDVISKLITPLFSVASALVVLYFLWGAFKFLSSGGDKEAVAGARGTITHAIIGFIILIFAFVILQFLLTSLFGITDLQLFKTED